MSVKVGVRVRPFNKR